MKMLFKILAILLISNTTWSCEVTDIIKTTVNGKEGYFYGSDCNSVMHKIKAERDKLKQDILDAQKQVVGLNSAIDQHKQAEVNLKQESTDLNKALTLKDLAIQDSEKRIDTWKKSTFEIEDRLQTQEKMSEFTKWLYFGGGIVVTGAAVYGAGQLHK